jgi:hypothetical protein
MSLILQYLFTDVRFAKNIQNLKSTFYFSGKRTKFTNLF